MNVLNKVYDCDKIKYSEHVSKTWPYYNPHCYYSLFPGYYKLTHFITLIEDFLYQSMETKYIYVIDNIDMFKNKKNILTAWDSSQTVPITGYLKYKKPNVYFTDYSNLILNEFRNKKFTREFSEFLINIMDNDMDKINNFKPSDNFNLCNVSEKYFKNIIDLDQAIYYLFNWELLYTPYIINLMNIKYLRNI